MYTVVLYFGRLFSYLFYAVYKSVDVFEPQMPQDLCITCVKLLHNRYVNSFVGVCLLMFEPQGRCRVCADFQPWKSITYRIIFLNSTDSFLKQKLHFVVFQCCNSKGLCTSVD